MIYTTDDKKQPQILGNEIKSYIENENQQLYLQGIAVE